MFLASTDFNARLAVDYRLHHFFYKVIKENINKKILFLHAAMKYVLYCIAF